MSDDTRQTFRDSAGREWLVEINVWQLRRVRQSAGVELGKMPLEKLADLTADPEKFVDVLYALVKDQADKAGVSDSDFGRGLGGDGLESAVLAFWRAYAFFSPSQTRKLLLGLADRAEAMTREAVARGLAALETLDPLTSNGSATNSPGPPESPRVPLPSAS